MDTTVINNVINIFKVTLSYTKQIMIFENNTSYQMKFTQDVLFQSLTLNKRIVKLFPNFNYQSILKLEHLIHKLLIFIGRNLF